MKSSITKILLEANDIYELKFVEENAEGKLPEGDILSKDGYKYLVKTKGIPDEEVNTILLAKQTLHLKTIKNILIFFFVLYIISAFINIFI